MLKINPKFDIKMGNVSFLILLNVLAVIMEHPVNAVTKIEYKARYMVSLSVHGRVVLHHGSNVITSPVMLKIRKILQEF